MGLYKLTATEKKYGFKQWLQVFWIVIFHPIVFIRYVAERREADKGLEQRKKEAAEMVNNISDGKFKLYKND